MPISDHPHARGENGVSANVNCVVSGPSPRTWGEPVGYRQHQIAVRTIPTHVGRTGSRDRRTAGYADHPHARGENTGTVNWAAAGLGPSPRTWGEPACSERPRKTSRTIPTHVGRTPRAMLSTLPSPDHPHARGENSLRALTPASSCGPSPRTWGEPRHHGAAAAAARTIPTHVGRTLPCSPKCRRSTDHPHARGENTENRGA